MPLLGGLDALERMIRRNEADSVIVALSRSSEDQASAIIKRLSMIPVDVYVYYPMTTLGQRRHVCMNFLSENLRTADHRSWRIFLKRIKVVVLSIAALVMISSLMLTSLLLTSLYFTNTSATQTRANRRFEGG